MTRRSTERSELHDAVTAFADQIVERLRDQILADMERLLDRGSTPVTRRVTTAKPLPKRGAKPAARPAPTPRPAPVAKLRPTPRPRAQVDQPLPEAPKTPEPIAPPPAPVARVVPVVHVAPAVVVAPRPKKVETPTLVEPEPFRAVPPIKRVRAPVIMLTSEELLAMPRDEERTETSGAAGGDTGAGT
jgi:hypothetical protein